MGEMLQDLSCQEVVDLVTEYLEGALAPERATLFEQHLNFCEGCVYYVDQIRTTATAVGRVREEQVPPEVREQLLTAFRRWREG